MGKTFKGNWGTALAIAVVFAFPIAAIFARRVTFYGYVGEDLGGWILFIALLIGLVFLLKVILDLLGPIGLALGVIGSWFLISKIDWDFLLPFSVTESGFFEFIQSGLFLAILITIFIIILWIKLRQKKKERRRKIKRRAVGLE